MARADCPECESDHNVYWATVDDEEGLRPHCVNCSTPVPTDAVHTDGLSHYEAFLLGLEDEPASETLEADGDGDSDS
jgi:hypothetical protein